MVDEKYGLHYKIAIGTTIAKHTIMMLILLAYMIIRFSGLQEQYILRIVYVVWYLLCIVIMCIHLSIIFYQMNTLMKVSKQDSVKQAQTRVFFKQFSAYII